MSTSAQRLAHLRSRLPAMIEATAQLVNSESPTGDAALIEECAAAVATVGADATGCTPEVVRVDGRPHLQWRFGARTEALLIGHLDTVWPAGTIENRPFASHDGRLLGPGVLDMKAGVVEMFEALATLDDLDGVTVLITSDEEAGSITSRSLVEAAARHARAALIFEPAAGSALKTARKGTGMYTLRVTGRAAHAGLEPEKGANALIEAAHLVLALARLARPQLGTTVTPTMAHAGTATNVVADVATIEVDVRVAMPEEAQRVDADLRALKTTVAGTTITVTGGATRPPMPASASRELFALARQAAERLGLADVGGVEVGGASDGNFTAALGVATLDGLGAVGEGAHSTGEYVLASALPERAALAAEVLMALRECRR